MTNPHTQITHNKNIHIHVYKPHIIINVNTLHMGGYMSVRHCSLSCAHTHDLRDSSSVFILFSGHICLI